MSRRKIIEAAMIAPAVVMGQISETPKTEEAMLEIWRQWNAAELAGNAAHAEYDTAIAALPIAMRPDQDLRDGLALARLDEGEAAARVSGDRRTIDRLQLDRNRIAAAMQARERVHAEIDLPRLDSIRNEHYDRADALSRQIEAIRSAKPIGIAAKLHLALARRDPGSFMEDYPLSPAMYALRDLMPLLPSDMAQAIAGLTDSAATGRNEALTPAAMRTAFEPARQAATGQELSDSPATRAPS